MFMPMELSPGDELSTSVTMLQLAGTGDAMIFRPFRNLLLCAFIQTMGEGMITSTSFEIRENAQKTQEKTLDIWSGFCYFYLD
jgi:hypothetical protein